MKKQFIRDFNGKGTRIIDVLNDNECVYEYGIDDSETLCNLLNKISSEGIKLKEILELICDIDVVSEKCSVEELIIEELRALDTVSYEYASAWHDYVLLSNFFDEQYDDDHRKYM